MAVVIIIPVERRHSTENLEGINILFSVLFWVFIVLGAGVVLQGVVSAVEGIRHFRYVQSEGADSLPPPQGPRITVIVPCKGKDFELKENLRAILQQDVPAYEVILVTAHEEDSAQAIFKQLMKEHPSCSIRSIVAGESTTQGEKVHNLLAAVDRAHPSTDVYVFADSDARPPAFWLRNLVTPLGASSESEVGATTGYRWYLPAPGNWPSVLRSAWNAGIATLLGPHGRNFCWGGSTAIRRKTFERIGVRNYWRQSVSDDYSMTQALRDARLPIRFVPRCLLPSHGGATWREVADWATRQMILTRIYSNKLWKLAAVSQLLFSLVILLGVALLPAEWGDAKKLHPVVSHGRTWLAQFPVTIFLSVIFLLGFFRGFYRWRSIRAILSEHRFNLHRFAGAYIFLPPLISLFTAYLVLRSAFTDRIHWRDRIYELISNHEMRVLQ